tara:strand:+ start:10632 stop:11123 length:492 start_codon:yes stop_codon:yes gene_type:complete
MTKLREPLSLISECGLPAALEVMGERWSFLILRAAFNGFVHFEDFSSELGIARNILSNRLARLVDHGVLARERCEDDKRKVEYRMTDKGRELLPAVLALRDWGLRHSDNAAPNLVLVDARDRKPIAPITIRAHDDRVLEWGDLAWAEAEEVGAPAAEECAEEA